jgi:hypothetical protein
MSDLPPAPAVRLVESVRYARIADAVLLTQARRALRVRGGGARLLPALAALRTGVTPDDLAGVLGGEPAARALLAQLTDLGWVTREPAATPGDVAWERQVGYLSVFGPDARAMQDRIGRARVAILGVGGIGASVAQHLVGAGLGELWLVDHDRVEANNLNRQFLFGRDDIGRTKVGAAARALARLSPHTRIRALRRYVLRASDLADLPSDLALLVVAADRPPGLMDEVWRWAAAAAVPVTRAAVGLEVGFWGPLLDPARGHCWPCFTRGRVAALRADEAALEQHFGEPTRYSFGPANSVIAALLAHDVTQYVAARRCPTLARRGSLDLADGRITYFDAPETTDCRPTGAHL